MSYVVIAFYEPVSYGYLMFYIALLVFLDKSENSIKFYVAYSRL